MDKLVYGTFEPRSIACLQSAIQGLKQPGCQAVILGCTEITLIVNDGNAPLPTLDPTRLLARAAPRHAVSGASTQ